MVFWNRNVALWVAALSVVVAALVTSGTLDSSWAMGVGFIFVAIGSISHLARNRSWFEPWPNRGPFNNIERWAWATGVPLFFVALLIDIFIRGK